MADDRRYVGGDNYILDDLSGFKIRASRARIIPGGITGNLAVAPERWEPQQPQDFVTGIQDDMTVALARPRQMDQFVILGTYVTARSLRGSRTIQVEDPAGFIVGQAIQIMLDTGVNFVVGISGIAGRIFTLTSPLPAGVGIGGAPLENSVLALGYNIQFGVFILDVDGHDVLDRNTLAPAGFLGPFIFDAIGADILDGNILA